MIRGKKLMRPLRKLKIQDKAEMNEKPIPDFIDEKEELTLLSAVNYIVTLAEDSELSALFFEKADLTDLSHTFQNVRVSQKFKLCCWRSSSNRAQQAISQTYRMWHTL